MDEVRLGSRTLQPGRQLLADGERVPIGKRALDIVSVLAEAGGEIVTKDELLEAVWPGVTVEENALQVHIVALRKALGPEADRLHTIRGVGYQLDIDASSPVIATPFAPEMTALSEATESPRPDAPLPAPPGPSGAAARIGAAWARARRHKIALGLVGLLVVLAGVWIMLGSELGLRPQERIPVVVRALTATGGVNQTEAALAGGITDELIVRLRHIPELRIATADPDGSVAGDAFRNAYVIDGTIRSSGDRLRVTARLVSKDGEILWSQTFDRKLAELFAVQEEIASAIANTLSVSFAVGANSREYGGTDNPEAYAAYMQSFAHQLDADQSVPRRYLEHAVALDPNFVKGWFGLGASYLNSAAGATTVEEGNRFLAKMDEASAHALAANPRLWIGHNSRGGYELGRRNLLAAERHFQRSADLDRGDDPQLRTYLANYAMHVGRIEEAAAIRRSNETIDPIHLNDPWKVFDLVMLGRHREAITLYNRLALMEQAGAQDFAIWVFHAHLLLGEEAHAIRFAEQAGPALEGVLRDFRATKAMPPMADEELRRSLERLNNIAIGNRALNAAHAGRPRLAVTLMRMAFEKTGSVAMIFLWHPAMAEARKSDEFEQLVTDLGLVKVWRESGDWGDYCRPVSAREIACT